MTQDPSNDGVRAVAVRGHLGKPPRELVVREGDLVKDTNTKMQIQKKWQNVLTQISVVCRVDHWWFLGEVAGARGLVPAQCIQVISFIQSFYPKLVIPDDEDGDDDDDGDRY